MSVERTLFIRRLSEDTLDDLKRRYTMLVRFNPDSPARNLIAAIALYRFPDDWPNTIAGALSQCPTSSKPSETSPDQSA